MDGCVPNSLFKVLNFCGGVTSTHSQSVRLLTVFVDSYGIRVVSNMYAQVFPVCVQMLDSDN